MCERKECTLSELSNKFNVPKTTLYSGIHKWVKWGYIKKQKLNQKLTKGSTNYAQFKIKPTRQLKDLLKKSLIEIEDLLIELKGNLSQNEQPIKEN